MKKILTSVSLSVLLIFALNGCEKANKNVSDNTEVTLSENNTRSSKYLKNFDQVNEVASKVIDNIIGSIII